MAPTHPLELHGGTSLAYTRQTNTSADGLSCENAPRSRVVELYSGAVYPAGCRKLTCLACLPRLARRRTMAITAVQPVRMIRLSLVADRKDDDPCTTALTRINRTRQALRRMGHKPGEWTFTVERNPLSTGYHAHCLQTGLSIAQSTLQSACESAGAGIPYINSISRQGVWSARYGLKGFGADGYGLKTFRSTGSALDSLRINNGRLEHHSRRFFTINGRLYGVRAAERAALTLRNAGVPTSWYVTMDDEAERLRQDPEARQRILASRNAPTEGSRAKRPRKRTITVESEQARVTYGGWLISGAPVTVRKE
jgi:hypothetical protein